MRWLGAGGRTAILVGVALIAAAGLCGRLVGRAEPGLRDGRLIAHLHQAIEVPAAPERERFLDLRQLPPGDGVHSLAVPFSAEPMRGLVIRLRVRAATGARVTAELRTLSAPEAARLGAVPRTLEGEPPGVSSGPLQVVSRGLDRSFILQRFDHLPRSTDAALLVIAGAFEEGSLVVEDAELPDLRGPEGPTLSPLVRRTPNRTPTGLSWRSGLVARPGSRYVFAVPIPPGAHLKVGLGHELGSRRAPGRFRLLQDGRVLLDAEVPPDDTWHEVEVALTPSGAAPSRLVLEAEAVPGARGAMRGLWGEPRIRTTADRPNVLLVTVDALRADHVGGSGYFRDTTPALDQFAQLGARFTGATAQAPRTWESVTALFSGRYPAHTHVRNRGQDLGPEFASLPDLLRAGGYQTFTGTDLANFPAPTLTGFDEAEMANGEKPSPRAQFRRIAPRFVEGGMFAWIHLENAHYPLLPREPLRFDPDYQGRFKDRFTLAEHAAVRETSQLTASEQRHLIALYDAGIRDADDELRGLLSALDEVGALEKTLVIVTADHGEQLGDHGVALDHLAPYEATLHVPLVIVWPGHVTPGLRIDARVQLIDLFPTIASLLGLAPPAPHDGRDLSGALAGEKLGDQPALAESLGRVFSLYRGSDHLLANPAGRDLTLETGTRAQLRAYELYDVALDPGETHDLWSAEPAKATALAAELQRVIDGWQIGPAEAPAIGQAAAEALRQAGYLQEVQVPGGPVAPQPEGGRR